MYDYRMFLACFRHLLVFFFHRRAAPSEGSGVCPFIPLAERHPGLVKRCDAAEGYIDSVCE